MRFSLYGLIPDAEVIAREYDLQPLKTEYIPNLKRELKPGWLMPYLYNIDSMLHGRWEYWQRLQLIPTEKYNLLQESDRDKRLANIQEHILPVEPIPQIDFNGGYVLDRDKGRKMLDICLDKMLTGSGYISTIGRIEYLLDWLLYGFGHPHPWFKKLPLEPRGCEGCSMVLYQLFDLFRLLYRPKDYWGTLIAQHKGKSSQKHTGYFPTPGNVSTMMGKMLMSHQKDARLEVGCEPAIGTGVMTLEPSNHILSMVGTDIDKLLLKATLVNWYLYCPWFAMPIFYLADCTDLLWGNSLAGSDDSSYPQSIHQKHWLEQYQNIYPVTLVKKDWQTEMQKIIDLKPIEANAAKIAQPQARDELQSLKKSAKPKSFKRPQSRKKFKSLF